MLRKFSSTIFSIGQRRFSTKPAIKDGPGLEYFIKKSHRIPKVFPIPAETDTYLTPEELNGQGRTVALITYGCQMNVNDMEIVRSVLLNNGYKESSDEKTADVVLLMTCSIRESAEDKIWRKLGWLRNSNRNCTIGVLGCMAERLRADIITRNKSVDVVAGPDSYRDLPRLLAATRFGQSAMNVQLSVEETYADIQPVRADDASKSAYVSIMRGCDNMCTYCVVPFTRGRERSRPLETIIDEVRQLSDQGFKQVVLLGQNVNSYRDYSQSTFLGAEEPTTVAGFKTVYKPKVGGRTFGTLLEKVSEVDPEMRIRFTSPHPKDFPLPVIQLIKERRNICNQLHLPAQSGDNGMLEAMGRGYSRELYLELVQQIKEIIPDISLTSDFIAGFCGESEEAHQRTVDLIREVGYYFCYVFPYSMRGKTRAHKKLTDDVPEEVKQKRANELAAVMREVALKHNETMIGSEQLVLVERSSKRTPNGVVGRADGGIKVAIDNSEIRSKKDGSQRKLEPGDYVAVKITSATSQTLKVMSNVERPGLVIPVALWGSEPPKFQVSELAIIQGGSVIVAGSKEGHIVQWRINEELKTIQPEMMLLAHEAPVSCIAPTSQSPTSTRYISCCQGGQICIWNSADGRCVEAMKHPFVHRKIIPYTYRVSTSTYLTRLFCVGDYAEVIVMDAQDLNILFSLSSRVEPDWINSLTVVRTQANHDVVIGISIAGMIKLWSLRDLVKKESVTVIYEDESKSVSVKNVKAVACSTLNTRIMLLVSASSWQIIDTCNLSQLIISECAIDAVDGTIIDVDKIAVCFVDSTIVLFQLPRSKLSGKQVSQKLGNATESPGIDQPFVFALLKGSPPSPYSRLKGSVCFTFNSYEKPDGRQKKVAYRADNNGKISIWKIPSNFDPLVEEFLKSKRPILYDPTLEQSLSSVWNNLNPKPPGVFADNLQIRSTIYVGNQGKLLLGCQDGSIVMMNACRTIMSQLLEYSPPEPIQHRVLEGHLGAVTCFLYPFEENPRYDPNILVSGGADFAVITWNIVTGSLLHRFCCQGGVILRLLTPPDNCNPRVLYSVCSIADDNSAALLSLKENKCIVLASRQAFPIVEIKWRPLDDFMMIRCEDDCVYVWQMETANLDRIVTGLVSEEVMDACNERSEIYDGDDEAGANQAMQMLRAIKNKNLAAVKRIATHGDKQNQMKEEGPAMLPSPIEFVHLKKCSNQAHIIMFNVDALIMGLLAMDHELANGTIFGESQTDTTGSGKVSLSSLIAKKQHGDSMPHSKAALISQRWQAETNLYMDTARLLISLIYAWHLDESKDLHVAIPKLRLYRPKVPLHFGLISRNGFMSLYMPSLKPSMENGGDLFQQFARHYHWNVNCALTTIHLIGNVALSNSLMSLQSRTLHASLRRNTLKRVSSVQSTDSSHESEGQYMKEGWSAVAAMHCVMLPDLLKPYSTFAPPKVDLLARRWQDPCIDIRDASQALLIRELNRAGSAGRKKLINVWAPYLPTLLDPSLSIFGKSTTSNVPFAPSAPAVPAPTPDPNSSNNSNANANNQKSKQPPPRPAPPIPPRAGAGNHPPLPEPVPEQNSTSTQNSDPVPDQMHSGINQVRRNQATAVVLLGVIGSEFPDDFEQGDVARATAHSLLELLVAPESPMLPLNSTLRRASIDLIGRGFTVWQPHLDISKVLLGLLELAAAGDKQEVRQTTFGTPLNPVLDASRTARHALSLIATVRAQALITALSMEVARYNSAAQHQTIQHNFVSPLIRSRTEVLRIIEQLTEKQANDVVDLIIPVGEILVHCLDANQLKNHTLAEIFPPIAKFYMIAYCPASRRLAFGGKNGSIVVHELKTMKSQVVQAHNNPITAVSFAQDGKYLAAYAAKDAKITVWQTQQSFLGMGQSQIRLIKSLAAPTEFAVLSPGGTYQPFRARLVWINPKSLTLMLPNGRENRFSI